MAKALFTIAGLGIVFIILLLGLPFFLPVSSYMSKVSEDVNKDRPGIKGPWRCVLPAVPLDPPDGQ